jgi:hypothetical protein
MLMAEKWAKRSSPPSSGVINQKPFESLNHFTTPVGIKVCLFFSIYGKKWQTATIYVFSTLLNLPTKGGKWLK